jgi:hypothetical protein
MEEWKQYPCVIVYTQSPEGHELKVMKRLSPRFQVELIKDSLGNIVRNYDAPLEGFMPDTVLAQYTGVPNRCLPLFMVQTALNHNKCRGNRIESLNSIKKFINSKHFDMLHTKLAMEEIIEEDDKQSQRKHVILEDVDMEELIPPGPAAPIVKWKNNPSKPIAPPKPSKEDDSKKQTLGAILAVLVEKEVQKRLNVMSIPIANSSSNAFSSQPSASNSSSSLNVSILPTLVMNSSSSIHPATSSSSFASSLSSISCSSNSSSVISSSSSSSSNYSMSSSSYCSSSSSLSTPVVMQEEKVKKQNLLTSENQCVICFMEFDKEDMLSCHGNKFNQHWYCIPCLTSWVIQQRGKKGSLMCSDIHPECIRGKLPDYAVPLMDQTFPIGCPTCSYQVSHEEEKFLVGCNNCKEQICTWCGEVVVFWSEEADINHHYSRTLPTSDILPGRCPFWKSKHILISQEFAKTHPQLIVGMQLEKEEKKVEKVPEEAIKKKRKIELDSEEECEDHSDNSEKVLFLKPVCKELIVSKCINVNCKSSHVYMYANYVVCALCSIIFCQQCDIPFYSKSEKGYKKAIRYHRCFPGLVEKVEKARVAKISRQKKCAEVRLQKRFSLGNDK